MRRPSISAAVAQGASGSRVRLLPQPAAATPATTSRREPSRPSSAALCQRACPVHDPRYSFAVSLQARPERAAAPPRRPWQVLREAPVTVADLRRLRRRVPGGGGGRAAPRTNATLIQFGAVGRRWVWAGQYWRLGTSMFLHIGAMHLFCNSWFGFRLCALAERRARSVEVPRRSTWAAASSAPRSASSATTPSARARRARCSASSAGCWSRCALSSGAGARSRSTRRSASS